MQANVITTSEMKLQWLQDSLTLTLLQSLTYRFVIVRTEIMGGNFINVIRNYLLYLSHYYSLDFVVGEKIRGDDKNIKLADLETDIL
jgi:hypothetical protein